MSANRVIIDGSTVRILALSSVVGVTTFLGLTDTPSTYAGQSLKGVRVNVGETALEFSDAALGVFEANYSGNDAPGTGANTLTDGKSRIWHKIDTLQSFLVTRTGAAYRLVELTVYT